MAARGKPAEEDGEIVRNRVITLTTTIGRGGAPVKNVAKSWVGFVDTAQHGSKEQSQDAYDRFLLSLADLELVGRKLAAAQAANMRELQVYEKKQQELIADIAQANNLIDAKKRELAEARVWRQQQEEYEVLRQKIIEVQPRHETQQQIDAVNKEIDSIQAAVSKHQQMYSVAAKKFAAAWHVWEDSLNSLPHADGGAEAAAEAAQPMQVDG